MHDMNDPTALSLLFLLLSVALAGWVLSSSAWLLVDRRKEGQDLSRENPAIIWQAVRRYAPGLGVLVALAALSVALVHGQGWWSLLYAALTWIGVQVLYIGVIQAVVDWGTEKPKPPPRPEEIEEQRKQYAPLLQDAINLYLTDRLTPEWEQAEAKDKKEKYLRDAERTEAEFRNPDTLTFSLAKRRSIASFAKRYLVNEVQHIKEIHEDTLVEILGLYHAHPWNIVQYAKDPPRPEPPPVEKDEITRMVDALMDDGTQVFRVDEEVRRRYKLLRQEVEANRLLTDEERNEKIQWLNERERKTLIYVRSRPIVK